MRGRGTQRRGRKIGIGLAFALAALGGCALATPALAAGSLSVTPNSNLTNGQTVTVTGSGFAASSPGGVLECNTASGEPTVTVVGNQVPVGCTNPLANLLPTTSASGALSYQFTIVEGTVGPPAPGTDTSGGNAATDAANYPCPPTPAQQAAGVTCDIVFGDAAGDQATAPITFQQSTTTSTTQPGSTTTTTVPPTTTTTAPPTTATTAPTTTSTAPVSVQASPVPPPSGPSSPSSPSGGPSLQATPTAPGASSPTLAFTGPGPGVWLLAFGGLVLLDLGYLVVTLYYRPRQLLARLLRRGGGGPPGQG